MGRGEQPGEPGTGTAPTVDGIVRDETQDRQIVESDPVGAGRPRSKEPGPGDAHLREFIGNASEAMILCDERGRVVEWNRGAEEITGIPAEQALGSSLWAAWHQFAGDDMTAAETRTRLQAEHEQALASGHAPWLGHMTVTTIRRADGTTRVVEHRPFAIETERGPCVGVTVLDVTERERSLAALRASEETLREFVRHASDAIVLTDEDGLVVTWNEATESLTGLARSQMLGRPYWEAYERLLPAGRYTLEQRDRLRESTHHALTTGDGGQLLRRPLSATFQRPDGSVRHAVQRIVLVPTSRGHRLAAISHDVTDQRRTLLLLEIQRDLAIALATAADATEGMRQTLDAALRIEAVDGGGIYAADPASGVLELRVHAGVSEAFVSAVSRFSPDAPETRAVLTGQVLNSADYPDGEPMQELLRREGLRAMLAVPVISEGRVVAVLTLASRMLDEMEPGVRSAGEGIASQLGGALARVATAASLRESEARYRTLVEEMGEGVAIVDPDETFVVANRAAEAIFGVEPGSLAGRSVAEFVTPETFAVIRAQTERRRLGQRDHYEVEIVRPDGGERTIVVTSTPRRGRNGEFAGAASVFADVTEQRRVEASLRRRAAFDELFATTLTRFATCAAQDIDRCVNDVMGTIAGFVGMDHALIFGLSPGQSTWSVTHEWCGEGVVPRHPVDRHLPLGTLAWSENQLLANEVIRLEGRDDYPPEAVADRGYMCDEGAISALLVPMRSAAGSVVGAIALHSHVRRIAWSEDDVLRLRMIGDAIAGLTDRVAAEAALRASEERFSKVFRSSPAPISITSLEDGLYVDANDALVRLFGYERDDFVGRTVSDLDIWADPVDRGHLIDRLSAGSPVRDQRTLFRHRDGRALVTRYSGEIIDLAGEACILSVLVDVTAQEQAEADRARLIAALEQSADAVLVTDNHGIVVYANRAFEVMFGRRRDDVLGRPTTDVSGGGPALTPPAAVAAPDGTEPRILAIEARDAQSHAFQTEWAVAPMADPTGESMGYVAVARDRTAERALQERLSQAQKLEAVGLLAGGIAHDFNNLITAIRGYAELIGRQLPEDDQPHRDAEQILRACDRAAGLVDQLATFSRRAPHRPRVLDPGVVIDGVTPMLRRLLGTHIDLVVRSGRSTGRLFADPGQLEQVIVNLAINARDAMPDGGRLEIETGEVELRIGNPQLTSSMTPGPHVMISVSDTGVGMDEPTLGRIFEPFFTTKEHGRGSGMGLAIVYGIVEQTGGSIAVNSAPGRGTTFTVFLPRAPELPAGEGADLVAGAGPSLRPRGYGTVLLVEDDEAVRRFAQRALRAEGYQVLATATGDEALQAAADHPEWSGLLVTDVIMPGMSGVDLADRLAQMRSDLRVLFVSGHMGDSTARLDVDRNDRALLLKPFSADALAERVGQLVGPTLATGAGK